MNSTTVPSFNPQPTFTLQLHTTAVNFVRFSSDGQRLLSGDDHGLAIWDVESGAKLQHLEFNFKSHGAVCAGCWVPTSPDRPTSMFAFGFEDGTIMLYQQRRVDYEFVGSQRAHNDPVEDIAFDSNHNRLATVAHGSLKVWEFAAGHSLVLLEETPQSEYVPRVVSFYNKGENLYVGYLDSQQIIGYKISPWSLQFSVQISTQIGHAAKCDELGCLFVTSPAGGMDTYPFPPTSEPVRQLSLPSLMNYPVTLAVAAGGRFVVIGAEDGSARLYDPQTATVVGMLPHGSMSTPVQTVGIHSSEEVHTIATASSSDEDGTIKIWRTTSPTAKVKPATHALPPFNGARTKAKIVLGILLYLVIAIGFRFLLRPRPLDNTPDLLDDHLKAQLVEQEYEQQLSAKMELYEQMLAKRFAEAYHDAHAANGQLVTREVGAIVKVSRAKLPTIPKDHRRPATITVGRLGTKTADRQTQMTTIFL